MNKKQIWVFAELSDGEPVGVYYELLPKARALADETGSAVAAVVLGKDISPAVDKLKQSGADVVYAVAHNRLDLYNCQGYACALEHLIRKYNPYMILIGCTAIGAELGPTVAAKVKTGLAAHCVDIQVTPERINFLMPAFGGKFINETIIPTARPMMASIRPGVLDAVALEARDSVLIAEDVAFLADCPVKEQLLEFIPSEPTGEDIQGAETVIAVGRGINSQSWEKAKTVSAKLGAPIGWSRAFVDTGLVPDESQVIGTSNKSIKANLLLAFGISGAAHFTYGISKCKTVVSINKDKNAPIFAVSDYGIVADADLILAKLLEKIDRQ